MNSEIKNYISYVRSGEVPVCKEQLLLCDMVEDVFKTEDLRIDEEQLAKYFSYEKYFPFKLLAWERFVFTLHNCVYRADGQLRWPILVIIVGRGAGKNGYLGFEDFGLLTPANGVKHYDIDIYAMTEDQAKMSFNDIYNVLEEHKNKMKNHFYWNKEEIRNLKTGSVLRYRTSGVKSKDSKRPGKNDFDEYHAYENTKIVDTANSGLGKVAHPRRTIITTNGDVRGGPFDKLLDECLDILNRKTPDNGKLPFICRVDNKEEIYMPEMWPKANPSLPYFPTQKHEMDIEFADFKRDPISNSTFATKRMNFPLGIAEDQVTSWENIMQTSRPVDVDLTGKPCVWGLDFATIDDFVSAFLMFKIDGIYYALTHTWVCKRSRDLHRIKFPLDQAEARGELTMIDDIEINPELPVNWLFEQSKKYRFIYGAVDHFRWSAVAREMRACGFIPETKVNGKIQGNVKIIRPSDIMIIAGELTRELEKHQLIVGDNMLFRWYVNNAKRVIDNKGNITFGKIEPKSRKTDGFMAYVAARTVSDKLDAITRLAAMDLGVFTY